MIDSLSPTLFELGILCSAAKKNLRHNDGIYLHARSDGFKLAPLKAKTKVRDVLTMHVHVPGMLFADDAQVASRAQKDRIRQKRTSLDKTRTVEEPPIITIDDYTNSLLS